MNWKEILQPRKTKIIIAVILAALIFLIFTSVIVSISHRNKVKISVDVNPAATQVFIDNTNTNVNNSTIYLSDGSHKISLFMDKYLYHEEDIYISQYTDEITYSLTPLDTTNVELAQYPEESNTTIETMSSEALAKVTEDFPITKFLPYSSISEDFNIYYEFDQSYNNLTIIINIEKSNNLSNERIINQAYTKLNSFGVEYEQYNIVINEE